MIDGSLVALLAYVKWFVLACGLLYVIAVFGISLIAARLRDPQGWLSWFPVVNLILVCRLAGANVLWALPALIPIINVFIFGYLGARIAERLKVSPALGALFGVPFVGAFVPLLLAISGTPLPVPRGERDKPLYESLLVDLAAAALLVVTVIFAFRVSDSMTKARQPSTADVVAQLSAPMAGTIREFPIDTATDNPSRPGNVATQTFVNPAENDGYGGSVQVRQEQLPPWIAPESLPQLAGNAISADYRPQQGDSGVSVVSLSLRDGANGFAPPTSSELASIGADAELTGVEVESADGGTYRGYRVSSAEAAYYMLQREGSDAALLISASDPQSIATADRLATSVGNGDGLLQYEDYRNVFYGMPSAPPGALGMIYSMSLTETDIQSYVSLFEEQLANVSAEDRQEMAQSFGGMTVEDLMGLANMVLPTTFSVESYAGDEAENEIFVVGVASYASGSKAWTVAQTIWGLRTLLTSLPDLGEVTITPGTLELGDSTAYTIEMSDGQESGSAVLVRKGSMLAAFGATGATVQDLLPWIEDFANR